MALLVATLSLCSKRMRPCKCTCECVCVSSAPVHLDCVGEAVAMPVDLCFQLHYLFPGVFSHLLQLT